MFLLRMWMTIHSFLLILLTMASSCSLPAQREHDLTLQDAKHSHPAQTLCTLCVELCYYWHQKRWVCSCSRRANPKIPLCVKCNILELARRSQQSSRGFCHCTKHPATICLYRERKNPVQSGKNDGEQCSEAAPDSCWAHTEPQQSGASVFLSRLKQ